MLPANARWWAYWSASDPSGGASPRVRSSAVKTGDRTIGSSSGALAKLKSDPSTNPYVAASLARLAGLERLDEALEPLLGGEASPR